MLWSCLQPVQDSTFLQYLPDGSCKSMIYEYQKLAAQDVRFDVPLADACMDDRMKYCGNVQPVCISRARFLTGGGFGLCCWHRLYKG
jgi:hypothetical protein